MEGRNNYVVYLKEKILELVKENPRITYLEISNTLPIGAKTVKKYFDEMVESGDISKEILEKRNETLKKKKEKESKAKKRHTEELVETIIKEYFNNPGNKVTQKQIAKKFNASPSAVQYHLKKLRELEKTNRKINQQKTQESTKEKEDDDEIEL